MCAKYSTGRVMVRVIVQANGRVKAAKTLGGLANSKAGACVAMAVRTARFPQFTGADVTFVYPFLLK